MVAQFEVDQANFAGRLHPSQRPKVVGSAMVTGVLMIVVATAIMVFLFSLGHFEAVYLAEMIPIYALFLGGLWIVVRRVRDLSGGRIVAVTGWSGPEVPFEGGHTSADENYGKKMYYGAGHTPFYRVRVGDRDFVVDKKLYDRTPVNCTNTAFFTSCTKRVLNVARTPGR